jgi:outer membrane receptor protein involved in Fe transport
VRKYIGSSVISTSALAASLFVCGHAAAQEAAGEEADELIITATRQEMPLNRVPASITALPAAKMEQLGAKSFAELTRYTPGVAYDYLTNNVTIRGIGSTAGAGTTGIYIDDAPIQMRALDFNPNNTLPYVYDLQRVEILRGPQGTLFGAGSEAGAVRYITTQPSLTNFTAHADAEVAFTENGAATREAGVAMGGPIVNDTLGYRVSAWTRREGGWIDKASPFNGALVQEDVNQNSVQVLRGALAWAPDARSLVTLSAVYQQRNQKSDDHYWIALSDPEAGRFINATPDRMADRDRFYLPTLTVEQDFGVLKFTSNTAYFERIEAVNGYSGTMYDLSYFQQLIDPSQEDGPIDPAYEPCPNCRSDLYPLLRPGSINLPGLQNFRSEATIYNRQANFTQEFRLASNDPDARFTWQAGLFYANLREHSADVAVDPTLPLIAQYLFGKSQDEIWGLPLLPGNIEYINDTISRDRQLAAFGEVTMNVTEQWKVITGLRYTDAHFEYSNYADGTLNFGRSGGAGETDEDPITPKIGLSYTPDERTLYYANAAKGFRIGGANAPFPANLCQADLDELQITSIPSTYDSDTVWSYEAGARNQFADGRVTTAFSAFHAKWSAIQQANFLPSCGFQYTANLGEAETDGFDMQATAHVTDAITLDAALGYTNARYVKDTATGPAPGSPIMAAEGDRLGVPPWKLSIGGRADFRIADLPGYARIDYAFTSKEIGRTPARDPATTNYDSFLRPRPETHFVSVRAGTNFDDWSASVFVNTVFDASPELNVNHLDAYTTLLEATTLRPRTAGLRVSYRR